MYCMATIPRKYVKAGRRWLEYFESQDCHQWIIALEHGKGGLEHWQLRWKQRGIDTKEGKQNYFLAFKGKFPEAHLEFTENWCNYERKEGNFMCSDDTKEVLRVRFGCPNQLQRYIVHTARTQGIRQIDVWLDKNGNHGKTWASINLYERGRALLVPRYCCTSREISNFICSAYKGEEFIVIDIPRSSKPKPDLYEAMEEIKDGVVSDPRYSGRTRNIRGVKLIVFTNNPLDTKCLSPDRWRLHGIRGA